MTEQPPFQVTAGPTLAQWVESLIEMKRRRDELDEIVTDLSDRIKGYIREVVTVGQLDASAGVRIEVPGTDIAIRVSERRGRAMFDAKRLYAENPQLHAQYMKPGKPYWEIRS